MFSRGIEQRYKAAPELRHLGESVRLAALVDHVKNGALLHTHYVRLEAPSPDPDVQRLPFYLRSDPRFQTWHVASATRSNFVSLAAAMSILANF